MVTISFAASSSLGQHLWSLRVCSTSLQALLGFRVSTEKFSIILIGIALLSHVTWSFPCTFKYYFFVLYIYYFISRWWGNFLFWSRLFGVLYASWTFMYLLLYISKIFFYDFAEIIFVTLICVSYPSSILFLRFCLFIVFQISWMFCTKSFFIFNLFFDQWIHFYYCVFNAWHSPL